MNEPKWRIEAHIWFLKFDELIEFCGRSNIDFVVRISQNIERDLGCIRGKAKKRN